MCFEAVVKQSKDYQKIRVEKSTKDKDEKMSRDTDYAFCFQDTAFCLFSPLFCCLLYIRGRESFLRKFSSNLH